MAAQGLQICTRGLAFMSTYSCAGPALLPRPAQGQHITALGLQMLQRASILLHRVCKGCTLCCMLRCRGCNYTAHGPHCENMVALGKQNTTIRVVLSSSFCSVIFLCKPLFEAPGDCYETPLYAWFWPRSKTCAPRARNDDLCWVCAPHTRFACFHIESVVFSEGLV